ncbi:unnamed protein product [Acanthosepion pharaonis]|uniref:Uncharacterized protein n=1 Tax=Acanthosepion pharaonis TaxID=158019 RepID=A0A812D8K0_ACAPH|nr:unnamed protein product [Sepia pharaonis]
MLTEIVNFLRDTFRLGGHLTELSLSYDSLQHFIHNHNLSLFRCLENSNFFALSLFKPLHFFVLSLSINSSPFFPLFPFSLPLSPLLLKLSYLFSSLGSFAEVVTPLCPPGSYRSSRPPLCPPSLSLVAPLLPPLLSIAEVVPLFAPSRLLSLKSRSLSLTPPLRLLSPKSFPLFDPLLPAPIAKVVPSL